MKTQFSKTRVFRTFLAYVILILIPLSILTYQGITSLENHKRQIEANIVAELRKVVADSYQDFQLVWQTLLAEERLRKYDDYHAVVTVEDPTSNEPISLKQSPLYTTVPLVQNLIKRDTVSASSTSPSPEQIFQNSLVGYFQFNPYSKTMTTPYDPAPYIHRKNDPGEGLVEYNRFLKERMQPSLMDHVGLTGKESVQPFSVLRYLKTKRLTKEREFLPQGLPITQTYTDALGSPPPQRPQSVTVGYYDFSFFPIVQGSDIYVACIRPVMVGNMLLIQGFFFNTLLLIQEAQAYLELYQPEYGSVVVTEFTPLYYAQPLFDPFGMLSILYRQGDDDRYLQSYYEQKQRFWIIMLSLILALFLSMVHLSKQIYANVDLARRKTNFISSITHELKAPLTSIIMYSEMLQEGWAKGKEATYYRYIHWESQRLSRLIKNILDYAGLERGIFKLKKTDVALNQLIEDALEPLKDWIENNGFHLEVDIRAKPMVYVDQDSLSQVVYNVCDNAIKYGSSAEQPTLKVVVSESETHAELIMFDNGPGVPKADEDKVFQRFYRCENELTRENTGTGLGLALVKELVEGNEGTLAPYQPEGNSGFGLYIRFPKVSEAVFLKN